MIYNTSIIVKKLEYIEDEYGIMRPNVESELIEIEADVQPITTERIQKTYGVESTCKLEVYTPYVDYIEEGTIIEYNGEDYTIESLIAWTELCFIPYMQFTIKLTK